MSRKVVVVVAACNIVPPALKKTESVKGCAAIPNNLCEGSDCNAGRAHI